MSGYGNNLFRPNDPVSRKQLAAIFYRYAQDNASNATPSKSLVNFIDKDSVSEWAQEAMNWAIDNGIINSKKNNCLVPKDTATRAEIATMFHRLY